jgi:diacylglycerol kinase family enzyme
MLVLLNPSAAGGRAAARWRRIAPRVGALAGPMDVVVSRTEGEARAAIAAGLAAGETWFVAAGGDGAVNLLVDTLVTAASPERLRTVVVGAIGLGSSNDFHKPYRRMVDGSPIRLDREAAVEHDICAVTFELGGRQERRLWIVNASIGATARANWLFNHPDPVLRRLKRTSTGAGIMYAAARAIAGWRSRQMALADGAAAPEPGWGRIYNIGIVKNPHFSGDFRYDSPHERASGRFFVHVLEHVPAPRLVARAWDLLHGRFVGRAGTRSWRTAQLDVRAGAAFPLEFDGEVVLTRHAAFEVLSARVRVCA